MLVVHLSGNIMFATVHWLGTFALCSLTVSVPAECNKTSVTIFRYLEKPRIFFLDTKKKDKKPFMVTTELLNDMYVKEKLLHFNTDYSKIFAVQN